MPLDQSTNYAPPPRLHQGFRKGYPAPGAEVHQDRQAGSGIGVTASQDSPEIVFIIHDEGPTDQHCQRHLEHDRSTRARHVDEAATGL